MTSQCDGDILLLGHTPKSYIPPNIAPKLITPENYLQIWDSSATLIGQLATVMIFGAMLGGIPLSGTYPIALVMLTTSRISKHTRLTPSLLKELQF